MHVLCTFACVLNVEEENMNEVECGSGNVRAGWVCLSNMYAQFILNSLEDFVSLD